jgi:hypothetical protein
MNLNRALSFGRTVATDWRWALFYLQRPVRSRSKRDAAARVVAGLRPQPIATPDAATQRLAADLDQEGQALLGSVLTAEQCAQTREHLLGRPVADVYRTDVAPWLPLGDGRHPHSHIGYHDHADVVRAPNLLALANRPEILAIVEAFLGCRPTISYMAAWWSYVTGIAAQQAENFHRDVDDWRFVKLFVYLTDVDDTKGPHVYVRKSANASTAGALRRYTDEEIRAEYPAEDLVFMTGNAGSAFLENTYGIHKGQPVSEGTRLIFQAVYSVSVLPYGPKRPVIGRAEAQATSDVALDPFVNRVYVSPNS